MRGRCNILGNVFYTILTAYDHFAVTVTPIKNHLLCWEKLIEMRKRLWFDVRIEIILVRNVFCTVLTAYIYTRQEVRPQFG